MRNMMKALVLLLAFYGFANAATKVDVNYYWSDPRCVTCGKFEDYTRNTVAVMNDNSIEFVMKDMRENMVDVKEYGLYTKSVILTKEVNGKKEWKNLTEIWNKVKNEDDFKNYIEAEVRSFQKEN